MDRNKMIKYLQSIAEAIRENEVDFGTDYANATDEELASCTEFLFELVRDTYPTN